MDAQEAKETNDPRNGVNWIQVASLKVATYRVRTNFYLAFGSKQVCLSAVTCGDSNKIPQKIKMSTHRPPQDLFRSKAELGLVLWQAGKVELIQFKFMTPSRINGKNLYGKKPNFSLRKTFQDTKS